MSDANEPKQAPAVEAGARDERVSMIQTLMLDWINARAGKEALAVWNRIEEKLAALARESDTQKTLPAWVFDNLIATLQPAFDYVQTHQEQFGALAGDDKAKIIADEFLRHARASEAAQPAAIDKLGEDITDEQIEAVWNAIDTSDISAIDPKLGMKLRRRFARALLSRQPCAGDKQEADNDIEEAREILTLLISSIEKNGPYSAEATCTFIRQALNCLPMGAPLDKGASNEALKSAYRQGYMAGWNRDREAVFAPPVAQGERGACRPFECDVAQREGVTCRDGECERAQIDGAPCWEDECDIVTRGRAAPSSASEAAAGETVPTGWKLVPVKSTPEMQQAFKDAYKGGSIWTDRIDYALDRFIAAAPQPASEQQPIPQVFTDNGDASRKAFGQTVFAGMSNSDDLWPVWLDGWLRASEQQDEMSIGGVKVVLDPSVPPNEIKAVFPGEQQAASAVSDAAILACAFVINGICLTRPQDTWLKAIEGRIRYMLAAKGDGHE